MDEEKLSELITDVEETFDGTYEVWLGSTTIDCADEEYKNFVEYSTAANESDWEVFHAKREQSKYYQGKANAFRIAQLLVEKLQGE